MESRVAICYFSGTGNTAYIVGLAEEAFSSRGITVDIFRIEDWLRGACPVFSPTGYDMIGIAHPVLGFGSPGIIHDFVASLPHVDGMRVFVLKTAADYHSVNNSASHSVIKALRRKGYRPFYDEVIAMPSNWLVGYDDQLNRQLVEVAHGRVTAAVSRILAHEHRTASNSLPVRLVLQAIGHLEDRVGAKAFGRQLAANSNCTRCGKCARNCPARNIGLLSGQPRFGDSCMWCMRCIYDCPQGAIRGTHMDFFILGGGYSLDRVREAPFEPIDFAAPRPSPWHRYFRRYLRER